MDTDIVVTNSAAIAKLEQIKSQQQASKNRAVPPVVPQKREPDRSEISETAKNYQRESLELTKKSSSLSQGEPATTTEIEKYLDTVEESSDSLNPKKSKKESSTPQVQPNLYDLIMKAYTEQTENTQSEIV